VKSGAEETTGKKVNGSPPQRHAIKHASENFSAAKLRELLGQVIAKSSTSVLWRGEWRNLKSPKKGAVRAHDQSEKAPSGSEVLGQTRLKRRVCSFRRATSASKIRICAEILGPDVQVSAGAERRFSKGA